MAIGALIAFLAIGAVAGALAGKLMKSKGFGLMGDMATGIICGMLGGGLFALPGITTPSSIHFPSDEA